jgi:hypothetical protein
VVKNHAYITPAAIDRKDSGAWHSCCCGRSWLLLVLNTVENDRSCHLGKLGHRVADDDVLSQRQQVSAGPTVPFGVRPHRHPQPPVSGTDLSDQQLTAQWLRPKPTDPHARWWARGDVCDRPRREHILQPAFPNNPHQQTWLVTAWSAIQAADRSSFLPASTRATLRQWRVIRLIVYTFRLPHRRHRRKNFAGLD